MTNEADPRTTPQREVIDLRPVTRKPDPPEDMPEKIEEIDRLRLVAKHETFQRMTLEHRLLELQADRVRQQRDAAGQALTAFVTELRAQYGMSATDRVDSDSGKILRQVS